MKEESITKYYIAIIMALIILIGVIFAIKNINKKEETNYQECEECKICEKFEPYKEYLKNLKEFQKDKFIYTSDITYDLADRTELYAILDKSNPLYNALKDKYEDIPGYCDVEKCEQGVKVTDKEIVDIFHVKQGKKDIIFILDVDGKLYYINQSKDNFES